MKVLGTIYCRHLVKGIVVENVEKRKFSQEHREKAAESGASMEDGSYPIETIQDLKNAIQAVGRAKNVAAARRHIMYRAEKLGALDLIPKEWLSKSAQRLSDEFVYKRLLV